MESNREYLKSNLKSLRHYLYDFNKIADTIGCVDTLFLNSLGAAIDTIVSLLEDKYEDTENHWISHFVFDCEFGATCNKIYEDKKVIATLKDIDAFLDFFFSLK